MIEQERRLSSGSEDAVKFLCVLIVSAEIQSKWSVVAVVHVGLDGELVGMAEGCSVVVMNRVNKGYRGNIPHASVHVIAKQ
jgi:hypothetical protein